MEALPGPIRRDACGTNPVRSKGLSINAAGVVRSILLPSRAPEPPFFSLTGELRRSMRFAAIFTLLGGTASPVFRHGCARRSSRQRSESELASALRPDTPTPFRAHRMDALGACRTSSEGPFPRRSPPATSRVLPCGITPIGQHAAGDLDLLDIILRSVGPLFFRMALGVRRLERRSRQTEQNNHAGARTGKLTCRAASPPSTDRRRIRPAPYRPRCARPA
jgi:hypothetical protein